MEVEKLIALLNTRLSYMRNVAAYKFNHKLPIYIPEREDKLLRSNKALAIEYNLPIGPLNNFINTQMQVSVDIQNQWIETWQQTGFPENEPLLDLNTEIRPKIKQVTQEITQELSILYPQLERETFRNFLKAEMHDKITVKYVTEAHKQALYAALISIKS